VDELERGKFSQRPNKIKENGRGGRREGARSKGIVTTQKRPNGKGTVTAPFSKKRHEKKNSSGRHENPGALP